MRRYSGATTMYYAYYFGSGVAIMAMLLVLLMAVGIVYLIFLTVPMFTGSNIKLECPHCGAETPAHLTSCQTCGKSFRDVAANGKSPLVTEWADDPPKQAGS